MARTTKPAVMHRTSCQDCQLRPLCLPVSLNDSDTSAFDQIVHRQRPVSRGTPLFHEGEDFRSIYAVRSGAIKTARVSPEGEEVVTGLYLAGEVIGLTAIDRGKYPVSATALDTTAVCEIPFTRLESLSESVPGLQRQLVKLMSQRLLAEQNLVRTLLTRPAEERLAVSLLRLSERAGHGRGYALAFKLPTSRHDLSNYLGLAPETLSRLFKRLEEQGVIGTSGREIRMLNLAELCRLAQQDVPPDQGKRQLSRADT